MMLTRPIGRLQTIRANVSVQEESTISSGYFVAKSESASRPDWIPQTLAAQPVCSCNGTPKWTFYVVTTIAKHVFVITLVSTTYF
ncbi:unnamed protein product [Protopolystoma xenopodis]|uniref:Uncharacterized protein n=1 Tax=Protopolystoma xenopodis TaxID=117903 RepID=A0A448WJ95_9PLAT|nr:unnamed protein product [Protopolystoma xenopodis]